jgi:hypothetical protein
MLTTEISFNNNWVPINAQRMRCTRRLAGWTVQTKEGALTKTRHLGSIRTLLFESGQVNFLFKT